MNNTPDTRSTIIFLRPELAKLRASVQAVPLDKSTLSIQILARNLPFTLTVTCTYDGFYYILPFRIFRATKHATLRALTIILNKPNTIYADFLNSPSKTLT